MEQLVSLGIFLAGVGVLLMGLGVLFFASVYKTKEK